MPTVRFPSSIDASSGARDLFRGLGTGVGVGVWVFDVWCSKGRDGLAAWVYACIRTINSIRLLYCYLSSYYASESFFSRVLNAVWHPSRDVCCRC